MKKCTKKLTVQGRFFVARFNNCELLWKPSGDEDASVISRRLCYHIAKRAKRSDIETGWYISSPCSKSINRGSQYAHDICKFLIGVKLQFFPVKIANFLLAWNRVYEITPLLAAEKQTSLWFV